MIEHSRSNSMSDDEEQSIQIEEAQKERKKQSEKDRQWRKDLRRGIISPYLGQSNKCKCNYCGRQYQCHLRLDGITNMKNHIKTCSAYKDILGTTKWKLT